MAAKMRMKAIFDCSADESGELTFKEGDILVDVVKSAEEGWYEGRLENSSERGLFPYNYVEPIPEKLDTKSTTLKISTPKSEETHVEALNNFPTLDAFEAAMSQTRKGASSNNNNSTNTQSNKAKQPVAATTSASSLPINLKKEEPIGLGIKLKPTGLRQDHVSRSRSYSTPSTPNTTRNQDDSEKTVRPSQLRKDQGIQSTLSAALSKGPVASPSPSGFKSLSKPESSSVPLVGLSTVKSIATKGSDTDDDEKLVKPSQLRNRNQVNKVETRAFPSLPSQSPSATWKKSPTATTTTTTTTTNSSSSNDTLETKKIAIPESNNSMPRLPSRPMSAAARKSRSSRTSTASRNSTIASSSTSPTKVQSDSLKTTPRLSPVKQESEKSAPPALKPKPNVAQPFLPPRPKLRSTSNPPPLQPKPTATTTLDKPVKKTIPVVEVKPSTSSTTPPPIAAKPTSVTLKQTGNTKTPPSIGSQKPVLPNRPSLDSWRPTESSSSNNASDNDSDNSNKNIKPSQLFNRARSATSPSSPSKPMDWNSSPIVAALSPKSPEAQKKKKAAPPPPPPSRQPKNYANNNNNNNNINNINNNNGHLQIDSASKARYEILFETINDDGYVDGETTQIIWRKSKLSDEDLASVWKECDPDHKGLLDKERFIEGMGRIDEMLSKQQHAL